MSRAAEGVRVPEVTSSTLATIGSELLQPREVGKRGIKVSSPNPRSGRQLKCNTLPWVSPKAHDGWTAVEAWRILELDAG